MSGQYKVVWLCEALLVSRSGYYDWKERRHLSGSRQLENIRLRERIREEFARSRQTYGSPRPNQAMSSPGGVSKKLTHPYCPPSRGSIHTSFFSGRGTRQIIST